MSVLNTGLYIFVLSHVPQIGHRWYSLIAESVVMSCGIGFVYFVNWLYKVNRFILGVVCEVSRIIFAFRRVIRRNCQVDWYLGHFLPGLWSAVLILILLLIVIFLITFMFVPALLIVHLNFVILELHTQQLVYLRWNSINFEGPSDTVISVDFDVHVFIERNISQHC